MPPPGFAGESWIKLRARANLSRSATTVSHLPHAMAAEPSTKKLWSDLLEWLATFDGGEHAVGDVELVDNPGELPFQHGRPQINPNLAQTA